MQDVGETTTVVWNDALEAIERCYELGWGDGLPLVPPTQGRVAQFLEAAGKASGEVVGEIPERRREITAGKVAANAVMAGCLPEYMPVVLAATEAMLAPPFNLVGPSSSMGGSAVLVIVNGPVAQKIGVNSRNNLFGPGNRANATIGRAIRLILMNACAAIPGLFDRSVIGHPGKYTYCIAEAESETHWNPLHVERGFKPDQSTVTVFASESPRQVRSVGSGIPRPSCTPSPTRPPLWEPTCQPRDRWVAGTPGFGKGRSWSPSPGILPSGRTGPRNGSGTTYMPASAGRSPI